MNKDESINRLLERTSRARSGARPQGHCLDPETLAAWADGALTAPERAAAEAHAADCDRCLAVVAAIAKTSPPPSGMQRPSWLSVRWLVPLTTAAVAITAWVIVQGPPAPERPAAPPAPAASALNPAEPAERESTSPAEADALEKRSAVAPPDPARFRDQAEGRRSAEARAEDALTPKSQQRPGSPPAAAAPAPAQPPTRAEAREESVQTLARMASALPRVVISPDPHIRWRLAGTSVERSIDNGVTWRAQATGTAVELLAGSSPAPAVCWIAGRSGLVLLSTDGETWRRLDFPDAAVDLVAVTANDGMTATVTAADGRRYRTTDAGRTWTLQENPAPSF